MKSNLWQNSVRLIAEANMASLEEIKKAINDLDQIIDTGYYDDIEGNELLKHIKLYLQNKISNE
jgi:hypothetical protein